MNSEETVFVLKSILKLWELDYKLAGTPTRVQAIQNAIKKMENKKDTNNIYIQQQTNK